MKLKTLTSLAMAALVVTAFGCTKTEEATGGDVQSPEVATTAGIPGTTNRNDLNPAAAQSYIDSVKMGHGLGLDGSIAADKADDNFTPGQPIHLAMTMKDAPADAAVKVVRLLQSGHDRLDGHLDGKERVRIDVGDGDACGSRDGPSAVRAERELPLAGVD
jgi:hypothetical protein